MTFRAIPGFKGLYGISEDGRVMSYGRTVMGGCRGGMALKTYGPRLLAPQSNGKKRERVRYHLSPMPKDGKAKQVKFYAFDLVKMVWGIDAANRLPEVFHKLDPRSHK